MENPGLEISPGFYFIFNQKKQLWITVLTCQNAA